MPKDFTVNKETKPRFAGGNWIKSILLNIAKEASITFVIPILTAVIIALLSLLFYINQIYIRINFTIPAYRWGAGFAISILIVYLTRKHIKEAFLILKWHESQGFLWRVNKKHEITGPYCPKCKELVVQLKDNYRTQMVNAFGVMQGFTVSYPYKCANPNCNSSLIKLDISIEQLLLHAKKNILPDDD